MILTGSTDRLVHLIDMNATIANRDTSDSNQGSKTYYTLKQGYKSIPNYEWDFPI